MARMWEMRPPRGSEKRSEFPRRYVSFALGPRATPSPAKYGEGLTRFSDGFSLLLTSEASVDQLMEETWQEVVVAGGLVTLRLPKPCSRCTIPRVHPFTGEIGPDPLSVLKRYRSGRALQETTSAHQAYYAGHLGDIFFGQNANSY